MKFDDMALFVLVAELGSFTKAADHKNMPKSTVSRRVKDLEDSLKVRLLDRTTRFPTVLVADCEDQVIGNIHSIYDPSEFLAAVEKFIA